MASSGVGCRQADRADDRRSASNVLRLATTTSTRDSGLLDVLLPPFEAEHDCRVDVIAVGSGKALKLGEAGDVDVLITHARAAEEAFVAAGHGTGREAFMQNYFTIVGPPDDPAGIAGMNAAAALAKVVAAGQAFLSRGDQSGTHQREMALWAAVGGPPAASTERRGGYLESGQGMGRTLLMADELRAYVLTDRGTYLRFKDKIELVPLLAASPELLNPYAAIRVDPAKHGRINAELSAALVEYLVSEGAQRRIESYRLAGEPLFEPTRLSASWGEGPSE